MLSCRNKDNDGKKGGTHGSTKKIITANPEEFDAALADLIERSEQAKNDHGLIYRIYGTVNARDFEKGIREFKRRQLEADYSDDGSRHWFYRDGFNSMVSCLQQPGAKATSLFLWDCDSQAQYEDVRRVLFAVEAPICHAYETKNGGHVITVPFNYTILDRYSYWPLIKKDAMMLWAY